MAEKPNSAANSSISDTPIHSVNLNETTINNAPGTGLPESFVSTGHINSPSVGRNSETALLDERSLLACMVRTIPAGGRIRISSTVSYQCYQGLMSFSVSISHCLVNNLSFVPNTAAE